MLEPDHLRGLAGGVLVGTASLIAAASTGKVPGISGILSRALQGVPEDRTWRWVYLVGLIAGATATLALLPAAARYRPIGSVAVVAVAGMLVGLGTRLSGGCTSGHGVCGLGAGSKSSLAAVCVFMATAMLVVYALKHVSLSP
jgi:hypothetical protein